MARNCGVAVVMLLCAALASLGAVDPAAVAVLDSLVTPGVALTLSKPCGSTYALYEPCPLSFSSDHEGFVTILDFQDTAGVAGGRLQNFVQLILPNFYGPNEPIAAGRQYTIGGEDYPVRFLTCAPGPSAPLFYRYFPLTDVIVIVVSETHLMLLPETVQPSQENPLLVVPGTSYEVAQLLANRLAALPSGSWSLAVCQYGISWSVYRG